MPSREKESRIPVGTQFSPDLIDLPAFLDMAMRHSGDLHELRRLVTESPVRIKPYKKPPTRRQRSLPLEAAVQYGLLSPDTYEITRLGKQLSSLERKRLHEEFARHILTNLGGLRVVQAAQEMRLDGRRITGDTLARYLTDQGFRVTVHNTAINTLRLWLSRAGLFPKSGRSENAWSPDLAIKNRLIGLSDDEIAHLSQLTDEQRAFVRALCRIDPTDWIGAAQVRDLAEASFSVRFGRASLPNEVLRPLQAAGLIEYQTGGTSGGKTSILRTTDRFVSEVLEPFLASAIGQLNKTLTAYYQRRPADFYQALQSRNAHEKGEALEAYTIYIMRLLGLRFMGWRRRARETGSSEVDALLGGLLGGTPTTWQVQCKNTPSTPLRLEDVAREVGIVPLTNATHILLICTGKITGEARSFARDIMSNTPLTIFMIDRSEFEVVKMTPGSLGLVLSSQAERIRDLRLSSRVWSGIDRPE